MKTLRHSREGGRSIPAVNPSFKLLSWLFAIFGLMRKELKDA